MDKKIGILLMNLGTPEGPDTESVKRYLDEFLMDPDVIDLPWIFRALLVKGIILRTRPKRSAEAYKKIWTTRGSPLFFHTQDLAEKVQSELGETFLVIPAMRYGKPSVADALIRFKQAQVQEIRLLPLYPQYARATTESSRKWVQHESIRIGYTPQFKNIGAFYDNLKFIDAFVEKVFEAKKDFIHDFVIFSFHGLPEKALKKVDRSCGMHCLKSAHCCDTIQEENQDCYRAHCFHTAKAIAERAGLAPDQYQVTFQSRLGPTKWIEPYTDQILNQLAVSGSAKRILMVSPSFVADCLETLEEIAIRYRELFIQKGGDDLKMVSSLNSSPAWVSTVCSLVVDGVKT